MIQITLLATREKVEKLSDFEKVKPCFYNSITIEHEGDLVKGEIARLIGEEMMYGVAKAFGVISPDVTTLLKTLYEDLNKKKK